MHSVLFFDRDGWPARSEQYDGTPAVPVKNQCKVVAGRPRMLQMWRQSAFCFVFLTGMVGLRAASNVTAPPPSLSKTNAKRSRGVRACSRFGGKVHSVLFFDRDGGGCPSGVPS